MVTVHQLTLSDLPSAVSDEAITQHIEILRRTNGDITEHLALRSEAVRRGLIAKIPADLSKADNVRWENALGNIGKAKRLVEELDGMSKDTNYSPSWRADKKEKLAEAQVALKWAKQSSEALDAELGLWRVRKG